MSHHRASYKKTMVLAAALEIASIVVCVLLGVVLEPLRWLFLCGLLLATVPIALTVFGGFVVLRRDTLLAIGKRDYFLASGDTRSESAIGASRVDFGLRLRSALRSLMAPRSLLVGDRVRVKSLAAIRATLDAAGCVDGLPFMPEMTRFCGREASVFRRVDKVYDYGGKKNLRRMRRAVLLHNMRCDGNAHGGCQAACYLLWKEAWLEPVTHDVRAEVTSDGDAPSQIRSNVGNADRYFCQFTSFVTASSPLSTWDPRPDLRPLLAGNVTLAGWMAVMLTRWFNFVQSSRGGVLFPSMPSASRAEPALVPAMLPGASVSIRSPIEIAATLDKNSKNRGLWFDRDMLKHCGRRYTVARRVDRIIDDITGQMRTMKTPCIVLEGVNYSGEGLRFCAQEENLYWREAWLASESRPDKRMQAAS